MGTDPLPVEMRFISGIPNVTRLRLAEPDGEARTPLKYLTHTRTGVWLAAIYRMASSRCEVERRSGQEIRVVG
jgi:hypothetical protein